MTKEASGKQYIIEAYLKLREEQPNLMRKEYAKLLFERGIYCKEYGKGVYTLYSIITILCQFDNHSNSSPIVHDARNKAITAYLELRKTHPMSSYSRRECATILAQNKTLRTRCNRLYTPYALFNLINTYELGKY